MTSDFSVDMNEYLPLRDVVFNTLRQAILKGELKPGERLLEIALAERLGVSRTPVREAMRKLEQEGLVVMIPRRGAQVASITEKDLNDVLEVRIALENVAIEKACKLITEEELGRLWVAAKEFEKTKAEGNLVRLAEADVAFHEIIYQASDNKRLNQVLNNLREQMYRYRVEYLKEEQTRNLLVSEHEESENGNYPYHPCGKCCQRIREKRIRTGYPGILREMPLASLFYWKRMVKLWKKKRFQYLSMKMNLISGSAVKTAMIF